YMLEGIHQNHGDITIQANATTAWLYLLRRTLNARRVSPRGLLTTERMPAVTAFPIVHPVVCVPARKLSYTFLAPEAIWITTGDDRLETIACYNSKRAEYGDAGRTLYGAYGPRLFDQLEYAARMLAYDPATRQSVIMLWRPTPPESKDIPCTVGLVFNERD